MSRIFAAIIIVINFGLPGQTNWQELNIPGGANINIIFKVTDSIFLAGDQDGSIYRTSNSGNNWYQTHNAVNGVFEKGITCFQFNSNLEIYAGRYDNKTVRSTDNGETWETIKSGSGEFIVNTKSGIMFSGDNINQQLNLTKSNDSGKTWIYLPHLWPSRAHIYSMYTNADTLYLGFQDSILYSMDFGNSWNKYGNSFAAGPIFSIFFLSDEEILAGTSKGFFYTNDHGITWLSKNSGITTNAKKINQIYSQAGLLYACGIPGILFSSDKGNSWTPIHKYDFKYEFTSLIITREKLLASSNIGIYEVQPGEFIKSSSGIVKTNPLTLNFISNSDFIYNSSRGLFKSTDGGNKWSSFEKFYAGCTFICKDSLYFVQTDDNLFYFSTDFGKTWLNSGSFWGYNTGMAFSKDSNIIYAGFYKDPEIYGHPPSSGVRYSTDFGANWIYVNQTGILSRYSKIISAPGNIIFADVFSFYTGKKIGLYRITNPYENWIKTDEGLPTDNDFGTLSLDKNFDLYASHSTGIYKLQKSNFNWSLYSNSMGDNTCITFNRYNNIVVVNNGKILISTDGKKWYDGVDGPPNVNFKIIEEGSDGYYYAASTTGRLFKTLTPHLINKLPSAPQLSLPWNNQAVSPDTVNLLWESASPLIIKYSINFATDSVFKYYTDTLVTDTSISLLNLIPDKKYYWRVRALNELGWGEYSSTGIFIGSVTNIEDEPAKKFHFSLLQNYPNPFNPLTRIKYAAGSTQYVTLKVYDILGNEIETLVSEEKPAGEYEVEFSGNSLASGIYFYTLRAGNFLQTKKLILVK